MKTLTLLLLAAALAGCQMDTTEPKGDETTSSISIKDMAFNPGTARNEVGVEITFTNKDSSNHNIVWDEVPSGANVSNSSTLSKDKSYSFTPTVKGTYRYHCGIHPSMTGKLIIN